MDDKDWFVVQAAAQELGTLSYVPALPKLKVTFLRYLGRVPEPRILKLLGAGEEMLKLAATGGGGHADVREGVAWAFGKMGARAADAGPLPVEALRDEYMEVRETAAWALGEIRSQAAVEPLLRALEDRSTGKSLKGELGGWAKESYHVRAAAAKALGAIGDPRAKEALKKAQADPSDLVREYATKALERIR